MKKIILLFAVISFLCYLSKISFAQNSDWLWAKSAGGTNQDITYSIAVDALGNTYIAGSFSDTILVFNSDTLINDSILKFDVFLAKYDANGNVLWAKRAGGKGNDGINSSGFEGISVAIDASGNAYMAGLFESPYIIFGFDTLTNAGFSDIFLAKYDANGNVLWAKSANGSDSDVPKSVALDISGNPYITGYFWSDTLHFDSINLRGMGSFLAKYDTNGNILWAKGGNGPWCDIAASVTVDSSGNAYMTGSYCSTILIFGSDTLTNPYNGRQVFLVKYDSDGNVLWARSGSGTESEGACSVKVDAFGNAYIAGNFQSPTISFGSIILTNTNYPNSSIFLANYDASGNAIWAKKVGGGPGGTRYATSIAVDVAGNIYMAGWFDIYIIIFGSDTLTNANYPYQSPDIFLVKFDANGNIIWAKGAGGYSDDEAVSVAIDALKNIYVAGYFSSPNLDFGSYNLTNDSPGYYDVFLAKLSFTTDINELSNLLNISAFPNPSTDKITIIIPEKATIEILNIEGQIIKTINNNGTEITIDLENLSSGVYIIKAKTEKGIAIKKFVKK